MAPLIFIHGAASSPDVWARQHRPFPRATVYQLPPPADRPPDKLLAWYAAEVLGHAPTPAVWIGHSMGGAVALTAAAMDPAACLGLVLVGSAPRLPVNPTLLDQLARDPSSTLLRIADWSLARDADPRLRERSQALVSTADPLAAWCQFAACAGFDLSHRPDVWPQRLAAIVGQDDRMTPPRLVRESLAPRPDVTVLEIPSAGHLVMLEQPDLFNRALRDILAGWNLL